MSVLRFTYRMEIGYEEHVGRCHFTIKCIPREDARQHLREMAIHISPPTEYSLGEDSFGNRQIYGCETEPHRQFVFEITGEVEIIQTDYEEEAREERIAMFRFPHGKGVPGPALTKYFDSLDFTGCEDAYESGMMLMHRIYQDFSYVPGTTGVQTTAEEAWQLGTGVCQDYAHIYVTLLRMRGIPARYVCGMMLGEGESHAWAEVLCGGRLVGFDPTNDRPVLNHYIKLGHGRDAADCAINRGLMWSGGAQWQNISVCVQEHMCRNED